MRFPTARWKDVRRTVAQEATSRDAWEVAAAGVLLALGALCDVAVPVLLGHITDAVLAGAFSQLVQTGVLLIGAAAVGAGLSAAGFYVVARVSERMISRLRERVVNTALQLPAHRVEEAGVADLVSRSTDDVAELSAAVSETAPALANSTFTLAMTALALVGLDWRFLAVIAAAGPLYWWSGHRYIQVAPTRYAHERAAMANRARHVLEAIEGRPTIQAFGWKAWMRSRVETASWRVVNTGLVARRTMMTLQASISGVHLVMLIAGLIVGFFAVGRDVLTLGEVTAAVLLLIRLRGPMMGLMRVMDTVQSGYASLTRIVGVIMHPPHRSTRRTERSADTSNGSGEVVLTDVSFAYDDGWSVRNINLRLRPGETAALVGTSGAGKSTLAALIAGMRLPDRGAITVDGVEVSGVAPGHIALLSQDVHVFSGTVREDLSLANEAATDAELERALADVGLPARSLPKGLDTQVGAGGMTLDPVAAQQLAMARILLLNPMVVVMDEATAEAGASPELNRAARRVTVGRTALLVAHRLDQAEQADRVYVMDKGTVIEEGTHAELVDYGGQYSKMWTAWQKGRSIQ